MIWSFNHEGIFSVKSTFSLEFRRWFRIIPSLSANLTQNFKEKRVNFPLKLETLVTVKTCLALMIPLQKRDLRGMVVILYIIKVEKVSILKKWTRAHAREKTCLSTQRQKRFQFTFRDKNSIYFLHVTYKKNY